MRKEETKIKIIADAWFKLKQFMHRQSTAGGSEMENLIEFLW